MRHRSQKNRASVTGLSMFMMSSFQNTQRRRVQDLPITPDLPIRPLSPGLGERMLPARLLGRPVVLRELMPQDLKLEIDRLTRDEAVGAARFLAAVVGHAHARQMDVATRRAWAAELGRDHPGRVDAPSWLWSVVVDLVARHERGYLHHCRDYALAQAG